MNHITMLRIMVLVNAWDETTFPIILWTYACVLEIEWWCESMRCWYLQNLAIASTKSENNAPDLSENE